MRPGRRRLLRALTTAPTAQVVTGVVVASTATTVTLTPDPADAAATVTLPYLAHYAPANGDVVVIYRAGALAVVIGKLK